MEKKVVVRIGGKQYLVKKGDELVIDKVNHKEGEEFPLEVLLSFDEEIGKAEIGTPTLKEQAKAKVLEHVKGDKIYVQKFKAKVRYRRRTGFRAQLSRIHITSI